MTDLSVTVAIVGAGPRTVGLLDRIAASRAELLGDRRLDIHLVDPHPPGPGRIWRAEQSPLLTLNTAAGNVTMFTDDSVTCDGPIHVGPSLAEWAGIEADTFPSRRTQSRYLDWVFRRTVDRLGSAARVHTHRTRARALYGERRGRQRLYLAGRDEPLLADVVVLAVGHPDLAPDEEQVGLRDFADRHSLVHLSPGSPADFDLSGLAPGEPVLVRGLGLAFIDLLTLLTEGRGGEYATDSTGVLRYRPSGREPLLLAGSRRGVPHWAKFTYRLTGTPPPLPRFFGRSDWTALLARPGQLDFRREVWPLLAKEIGWAYYHELFTAHPDRTTMGLAEFTERYAVLDWHSTERVALVRQALSADRDVLDVDRLDRPLLGVTAGSLAELQPYLWRHLVGSVRRSHDPTRSPDLAALLATLSAWGQLDALVSTGRLSGHSVRTEVRGRWSGFLSQLLSGPPAHRLDQLRAAAEAGVVSFLGADMWVRADHARGVFRAGSASMPEVVEATTLVEARLPATALDRLADPLLRSLRDNRDIVEEVHDCAGDQVPTGRLRVRPADARIIDRTGKAHPCRFALGPFTDGGHAMAFAPPRVDAPTFRHNDADARAILRYLAGVESAPARTGPGVELAAGT
ncbi:FAD/NAD(P)-binding protein [Micromonospora sonneratiae]|uniref:FAD/NAD(P)-binding protein n=1 Tax=Micromonospora sonneratiae TaxID=1184706 RepID=A0ABW3YKN9_9ACTN